MTPEEAQSGLDALRAEIDRLDVLILQLLNDRAGAAGRIGDIKKQMAMAIYEPKREEQVFRNVLDHNEGPLSENAVRRLFERIIDEMRLLQKERNSKEERR
jgi:chorismate mutase